MLDLGRLGEGTFSLWCSQEGLIPNGSKIDKTGWDFLVEFPEIYRDKLEPIHSSPIECRVQVKATNNSKKKLSINLKNLWRMSTIHMPAYYVFIEFDGKNEAQAAYVVHVDHALITDVLKRLHITEQSDEKKNLNRCSMTIHYSEQHRLENLDGACLKDHLLKPLENGIASYISEKAAHISRTGYEEGAINLHVTTSGEKNLRDLIDVSLGLTDKVEVDSLVSKRERFGIVETPLLIDSQGGFLSMEAKPSATGKAIFREDSLSVGLTFDVKLYFSPFHNAVPEEMRKIRMEGDYFDIVFYTSTATSQYSVSVPEGMKLDIRHFHKLLRLMQLLNSSGSKLLVDVYLENSETLKMSGQCDSQNFMRTSELNAFANAVAIIDRYDSSECVEASIEQVMKYEAVYSALRGLLDPSWGRGYAKLGFALEDTNEIDFDKEVVCITSAAVPIGDLVFGMIVAAKGKAEQKDEGQYELLTRDTVIEKKMITKLGEEISKDDLMDAKQVISDRYEDEGYDVIIFTKD